MERFFLDIKANLLYYIHLQMGDNMRNSYLNKQLINAKENYNYFVTKLITGILRVLIKLAVVLLIGSIFNNLYFTIFEIIFTIYSLFNINYIIDYYTDIMKDIRDTAKFERAFLEIDFGLIHSELFHSILK